MQTCRCCLIGSLQIVLFFTILAPKREPGELTKPYIQTTMLQLHSVKSAKWKTDHFCLVDSSMFPLNWMP